MFQNPLLIWVLVYLVISVAIGIYVGRKVKSGAQYVVAGRSMPMYITIATVFATWFGSEAILGVGSEFAKGGITSIISDPFGASLCLILAGAVCGRKLYRMQLLTLGDFYRQKYGSTVEVIASLCIILSYVGWIAAQMVALGVIFHTITGGAITEFQGAWIGGVAVLLHTVFGGMVSVAISDFIQMIITITGMIVVLLFISWFNPEIGSVGNLVNHAYMAGKFDFFPNGFSGMAILMLLIPLLNMGLGSIPQEDVFQRVMSAKNEKVAVWGSIYGGMLYFVIAFLPIMIGYSAYIVAPEMVSGLLDIDKAQLILPTLIMEQTPLTVQIFFFGALLSAVISTASATLIAPSALVTQNILRPYLAKLDDRGSLWMNRGTVVFFFIAIMLYVSYQYTTGDSNPVIYTLVESAYRATLAGALVPLAFGVFLKNPSKLGGLLSILVGLTVWMAMEKYYGMHEEEVAMWITEPHHWGFVASIIAFVVGQVLTRFYGESSGKREVALGG